LRWPRVTISTRKEFEEWLKTQPREVCVAIAYRAAMRVLPLAALVPDDRTIWTNLALAAFRASLTSGVAAVGPTPEVNSAADAARAAADAAGAAAADDAAADAAADAAYAAARAAAGAARAAAGAAARAAARAAADAAADAAYAAARAAAGAAARAAARAAADAAADAAYAAADAAIFADSKLAPETLPVSVIPVPAELTAAIAKMAEGRTDFLASGGPWTFWTEWHARAMAGDPLPWDLQEKIALIPNDIWEAGPEAVAVEIERIEAEFLIKRLPQSDNIVFDHDEGVFRKETAPAAKPDLLGATLASVADALDDVLAEPANGLTERSRETRVLRRMLDRYGNDPQRIEMDCTGVHRALTRQILTTDELPASEANLALQEALLEAAQGIRATHPDIAENRRILSEQALRELPEEADDALKEALPVLQAITDETLGTEFAEDVLYLTEEMRSGPPRALVAGERNPVLAGYDEKVRVFGRVGQMLQQIRSSGNTFLDRLEEKHRISRGSLLGILVSLVGIAISIL
jgi:hypothetical protein